MEAKKSGLFDKIKKIKGMEYILIGIVALIIAVIYFSGNAKKQTETSDDAVARYVDSLERRLSETLSAVKGAGKVSVAIKVAGGNKTVLAADVVTVKNGEQVQITESPLIVGGKVVVLAETYPEITGVLIVAAGASDIGVRTELLSAATTLLSVEPDKVEILAGK